MTTNEREIAIREGHKIHAETSYFKPRPQLDFENARHVFCEGFDRGYIAAAKADSEREKVYTAKWKEIAGKYAVYEEEADLRNEELKTHIDVLREALEAECGGRCNAEYNPCNARQALASTPAQSLQAHDNEVIERFAVAMENYHVLEGIPAMYIRALKGKL